MTLQRIEITDTCLWVLDSGPAQAAARSQNNETIVFSHGLLFSTELFAPQIAALQNRYRCIAYDHRGQGRSADSDLRSISMELLYQDAVALLTQLAVGPVHWVGLSMGGFVGMRLAARRPDLVRSLSLLETSADGEPQENLLRYRALSMAARVFGMTPLLDRVMPIVFGRSSLSDPENQEKVLHWRAMLAQNRRSIWRAVNGVIERVAIYPELDRIRCPTLIVAGEEDVATVPAKAERMHRAIAGSRLVRIARAGHSSTIEQPEQVNRWLIEHLDQVTSKTGMSI